MQYTQAALAQFGTIMGVWAHPDDESWSMAGIAAAARQNGQRVVCITATRGEAGQTADEARWPYAKLQEIRTAELAAALRVLDVQEHHWLDYHDGTLAQVAADEPVKRIAALMQHAAPDTIFTFGPDGITGHDDHKTICQWTLAAAALAAPAARVYGATELAEKYDDCARELDAKFNIYFNTDKPVLVPRQEVDLFFELDDALLEKKIASLRAQASQMSGMFADETLTGYVQQQACSEHFMRLR